ncbi:MAG: hypothetical protein ACSHYF_04265 [Verrucomicrobiaceae bacterium]
MNSLKAVAAIGLSALAIGSAAAQDAASKPVGYETLDYGVGFTPVGLRLHQAPVTSGVIASADATSITVTGADFGALLTSGTDYVLEIENANGVIQIVNTWAGETITTPSDLSGEVVAGTTTFTIRPVATLNSVFGSNDAEVTIAKGGGNPGTADQIWLSDGAGGYNKYYFDSFAPPTFASASWAQIDAAGGSAAVDGGAINLVYADGIVINAQASGSHVVTGSVKLGATELELQSGFTFVSSVAPAGATLQTAFPDGGTLVQGGGNPGTSDQIWVQNAAGGYDKYYFDAFAPPTFSAPSWAQIDAAGGSAAVDGATVSLPAGYVINSQGGGNVTQGVPSYYSSL